MKQTLVIKEIGNGFSHQIIDLILPIQQIEFNVPVTMDDQPDLLEIEKYYYATGGGFWGAFLGKEIVGTIALIATDRQAGAIRKMFVKKELRGKEQGIAQKLLSVLITYCLNNDIKDLYLGTVDMLKAAHRFYEKNGFERLMSEEMPEYFPRMKGENVYYHLPLVKL